MLIEITIKSIIIYFVVMIVIKFMGKREIGQLSVFDFAVLLIIADILVSGISDGKFIYYIIPIVVISLIQRILAFIMLKKAKIRNFIEGKVSNIIIEGKLQITEMRKLNYNIDDLLTQLRLKNIRSISEVRYAILETNGELSVFKFEDFNSNSSNSDNQSDFSTNARTFDALPGASSSDAINGSKNEIYPYPLIVSGIVNYENLYILNLTEDWLNSEINKRNLQKEDILYANYENNELFIAETEEA